MAEGASQALAERIDALIRDAVGEVVAEAREEGWRDGYAQGRIEVRREMNARLRALILDEDEKGFVPQPMDAEEVDCRGMHALIDEVFGPEGQDTGAGAASTDTGPHAEEPETNPQAADEPPAPLESPVADVADAPVAQAGADTGDAEETAAAVPAAAPSGPGAESVLNPTPPPPQQAPEADPEPSTLPASAADPKPVWPPDWRTAERKKTFIELYERGDDMTEIRLTLADMPGPRMPNKNVALWGWVTALKIKRGTAARPAQGTAAEPPRTPASHPSILPPGAPRVGMNPKAAAIPLPPPSENGKVYTSFENIRAYAGIYGLAYDGTNIDRVNKLRTAKGLPPLAQEA